MIPVGVRTALCRAPLGAPCCQWSELAAMVQLGGRMHVTLGGVVLVGEVPAAAAAERLCRLIRGLSPDAHVALATPTPPPTARPQARPERGPTAEAHDGGAAPVWTVLARPATQLARRAGLLNRHNQPLVGLPARVLQGRACCAAAVWRAALLATPATHRRTTDSPAGLAVRCPNQVLRVALVGLARCLEVRTRMQTRDGVEQVHIDPDDTFRLLTAVGAPAAEPARRCTLLVAGGSAQVGR